MPSTKPLPQTLAAWLKELTEVQLPMRSEQRDALLRQVTDSRRSVREIADSLYGSPTAALCLLRAANSSSNGLAEPAEGLELAINRLGLQRTEELLRQMPHKPAKDYPQPLAQLVLISQHAGQQASGLFASRLARLWQEIHCSSLLFLSPLWLLACSRPELYEAWEKRVLIGNEPAARVERELLGLPLLRLCLALSEKLRLPEWVLQGYRLLQGDKRLLVKALHIARNHTQPLQQQHQLDDDAALRRWLTRTENSILLANCIAASAHHDWDGDHCLRWQRLTGLCLKLPVEELRQTIHQYAVLSARQHAGHDLWHPAQALLWPPGEQRWQHRPEPAPAPAKPDALGQWRQLCGELLREPSAFANVLQLTACAMQALQLCGMRRILLLLADRQHTRLVGQQCFGLPADAARLTLDPSQSPLLRHLLAQPGQLRIGPDNMAKYSALLPGGVKALFPSEHLLLRSLASNQRVVMLLVADQAGAALGESSLQGFAKTVQCIERALGSFSRRER